MKPMEVTEKFLSLNNYSRPGYVRAKTKLVVIHWPEAAGASALQVWQVMEDRKNGFGDYGSTQAIIGLNGEIIQTMPIDEVAWQCGTTDTDPASGKIYTDFARKYIPGCTVYGHGPGFEVVGAEVCHPDWGGQFNEKTYEAATMWAASMLKKYGLGIERLCRHYDIVGNKLCPLYYCNNATAWEMFVLATKYKLELL